MDISEKTIRQAWGEAPPPAAPLKMGAEDFESIDLFNWIRGKSIEEVSRDDGALSSKIPFLCLSEEASAFYLGAYLLWLTREIRKVRQEHDLGSHFATVHLLGFLASPDGLAKSWSHLSKPSKAVVAAVLDQLINGSLLPLETDVRKQLKTASSALVDSE